jgi:hypothetical protein
MPERRTVRRREPIAVIQLKDSLGTYWRVVQREDYFDEDEFAATFIEAAEFDREMRDRWLRELIDQNKRTLQGSRSGVGYVSDVWWGFDLEHINKWLESHLSTSDAQQQEDQDDD